jgi:hypothetical protein
VFDDGRDIRPYRLGARSTIVTQWRARVSEPAAAAVTSHADGGITAERPAVHTAATATSTADARADAVRQRQEAASVPHAARAPPNPPASGGHGACLRRSLYRYVALRRWPDTPPGLESRTAIRQTLLSFGAVSFSSGSGGRGGYIGLMVHTSGVCQLRQSERSSNAR